MIRNLSSAIYGSLILTFWHNGGMNQIFKDVRSIISPVYLVGGSVRDEVLGHEPHDYDFTTPLTPDDIESRVRAAGRKPVVTGKRFGTIAFRSGEHMVEVTTFRSETYQPGSRKPEVEFVSDITHDLSRRDFTVNAMAEREDGTLIDPFGGREDLQQRLIRTVGRPYDRFKEDPLRMLRAARLASQLNFDIDPETEEQAGKKAAMILEVSKERWSQELDRTLVSAQPSIGLEFLARTRLLHYMIPELAVQVAMDQDSPYHELDLWHHSLKTVNLAPRHIAVRWAALLHDVGKPYAKVPNQRGYSNYTYHELIGAELAGKIGRYLKWPNDRIERVTEMVRDHLQPGSPLEEADGEARYKGQGGLIV